MCPVCTVGVIAGLGISRVLGIDDVVASVWIGGFILSFSFIVFDWLKKKWPKLSSINYRLSTIFLMYFLVFVPLKFNGSLGIPGNTLWGADKIVLGTFIGTVTFLIGIWADKKIRKIRGKQLFQFQKVVFPILGLIIPTAAFLIWL